MVYNKNGTIFTSLDAVPADIPEIMRIIDDAKRFLASCGVDQWQDGFPESVDIAGDIAEHHAFIVESDGVVAAYVCLSLKPEYSAPIRGAFRLDGAYGTIHRTAVSDEFRGSGLSAMLFAICREECQRAGVPNLRIDTHRDNLRMRHIIAREGFTESAVVVIGNGTERIVFERRV